MKIENLISPERIRCNPPAKSKKKALEILSQLLQSDAVNVSHEEIFENLTGRERLGSTGLGHGVALPHARVPGQEVAIGAFIKLDEGIDFDSIDNQPADLLFSLLVPDHFTDEHLDILSQLANMFNDAAFCEKLRNCQTEEQLHQLLTSKQASSAA